MGSINNLLAMDLKSKRITSKVLVEWLNWKFKELEINNYFVTEVVRTHFNIDQIEGGAARLYIRFKGVGDNSIGGYFLCFYTLKEIQSEIAKGCKLYLKIGRFETLSNIELDLK